MHCKCAWALPGPRFGTTCPKCGLPARATRQQIMKEIGALDRKLRSRSIEPTVAVDLLRRLTIMEEELMSFFDDDLREHRKVSEI